MEVTTDALEFSSDDTLNLRAFLATRTGTRLLPKMAESIPALLTKGADNEIFIRSGEVRGFQIALNAILALANPAPEPVKSITEYANLADDTAFAGYPGLASEKISTQPTE